MTKKSIINVDGTSVSLIQANNDNYVSLTDIAKQSSDEPRFVIRNWLSSQNTISYLGTWETTHNQDFDHEGYKDFKNDFFEKPFSITPKKWTETTKAKGIISKSGRYGGTYAHQDIAINFCYWLSPAFQVYLIKEFKRLKEEETQTKNAALDWTVKRILSKANYYIHTEAIKHHLIPNRLNTGAKSGFIYANEADILNVALFGVTAKQWKSQNPELNGNMRDFASAEQLLVLANLENLNAQFIKDGLSEDERAIKLNDAAIHQMQLLVNLPSLKVLKEK